MKPLELICFALLIYLVAGAGPAYGYLDPATGSMALQVLIGGLLAVAAVVRMYWKKVRRLFGSASQQDQGASASYTASVPSGGMCEECRRK